MRCRALITCATLACTLGALTAAPSAAAQSVADIISARHVREAAEPVRTRPGWAPPRTVLLLAFHGDDWSAHRADFAAAAPGARIIAAPNMAAALAAAPQAQVVVGFNPGVCDARLVHRARQLRWIESLAAGVDNCMTVPEIRARSLLLTNMRGVDAPVIAEHAIALALALAHGLDTFVVDTEHRRFSREHAAQTPMQSLTGKTLLVVGLGGIGTEVALRAHGLGMRVVATNAGKLAAPDYVSHVGPPGELAALARQADVIVSCVPLTPQTRGMYDARFFALLKPSAFFINVARGGSVVTDDLAAALAAHRLAGAGLDVVDPEPLPPQSPLWSAPHVIITPHISSRSDLPGEARWLLAVENLRRYAAGGKMLSVVDLGKGY
ncbi:MAG TPA: NAD(P)-dependent oxidoreductase [Steroidobacteraceae bacterium]|nr:NAD(P)-dependent oxidoreductase [Steroidobacteraceae bacterium]